MIPAFLHKKLFHLNDENDSKADYKAYNNFVLT